jgi:hypothetical protein
MTEEPFQHQSCFHCKRDNKHKGNHSKKSVPSSSPTECVFCSSVSKTDKRTALRVFMHSSDFPAAIPRPLLFF